MPITNENWVDRGLRIVVGIGVLSLTVAGPHSPWGLLGFLPLLTGAVGFCPLYRVLGIGTCAMPTSKPA